MKKLYALFISLLAAGTAMAFSPAAAVKTAKAPKPEISQLTFGAIQKVGVDKTATTVSADGMMKTKANAPTSAEDLVGVYSMDCSYTVASTGNTYEESTTFEIVATDDPTVVTIKNFLSDFFGIETNDLEAELYEEDLSIDDAGTKEAFTFLKIGLAQTLFTDDEDPTAPVDCKLYLYGPFAGDGKNYVFTGSEIEFIAESGMLMAAYSGMGLWVGYEESGKLYGYPAIFGPNGGQDDLLAYKCNATIAGQTIYQEEDENGEVQNYLVPFSGGLLYAYNDDNEDECFINLLGLFGYDQVTSWIINKENHTAVATNNVLGEFTYKFKKYDVLLVDEASLEDETAEDYTATVEIGTSEDNKTTLTFNTPVYAIVPSLGWLDVYYTGTVITLDKNLFPGWEAGVANVAVDDANAPVKFYNLQGIELANPQPGQVVVRVQGQKADKLIIR